MATMQNYSNTFAVTATATSSNVEECLDPDCNDCLPPPRKSALLKKYGRKRPRLAAYPTKEEDVVDITVVSPFSTTPTVTRSNSVSSNAAAAAAAAVLAVEGPLSTTVPLQSVVCTACLAGTCEIKKICCKTTSTPCIGCCCDPMALPLATLPRASSVFLLEDVGENNVNFDGINPNDLDEEGRRIFFRWTRLAIILAVFTVIYNVAEGSVSIYFGVEEESLSVLGFGFDSFIEVTSAIVVCWRLHSELNTNRNGWDKASFIRKERRATIVVGLLLILLAVSALAGAVVQLIRGESPDTSIPALIISSASLSFMFILWYLKRKAARILDSSTLYKDACCSLGCIHLSLVLLVSSVLFIIFGDTIWWIDSAGALVISLLIGWEGFQTIHAAMSPDFDGGCGCGASKSCPPPQRNSWREKENSKVNESLRRISYV